jgi:hypothetical protein
VWAGTTEDEVVATAWTNSWSYARLLPSRGWSGGAHALPRRLVAVSDGRGGHSLRQLPAALPPCDPPQLVRRGGHLIGRRALITITGLGSLRLGDLTLRLNEKGVELVRDCGQTALLDAHFAGRWFAPCSTAPICLLLDGCVAEMFAQNGSMWMSALTLRDESVQLEIGDGLTVTLQTIF